MSTGDSWSSVITRELMARQPNEGSSMAVQTFFVSYMLVVSIVLVNIDVCVCVCMCVRARVCV